jgi:hypothetical protein
MAYDAVLLYKQNLPGGGFNTTGVPQQGKVLVVYRLNITLYTTGGESFTARDIGLENVDYIQFDVESANNAATQPGTGAMLEAGWDRTNNLLVVDVNETEVTTTEAAVVRVLAVGDTAATAELL